MQAKILRSSSRKTVSLHIEDHETIIVRAPTTFPSAKIKQLLQEHAVWIKQQQQTFLARSKIKSSHEYWFLGKTYQLAIRSGQKNLIELEDKFYFALSHTDSFKTYITRWYKQQAQLILTKRVQHYAKKAGLTYRTISITNAQTRWGSCSSQKTLNFNWRLVMAPLEVIDYVISHELAHLTEMNHSADFWETVRKMYPLYRQHRTWLKRYGHLLKV